MAISVDERAAALQLLAKELNLTKRQRLLAEITVANPDMSHVEAARAATCGGRTDNALAVQANEILALPKVQAYRMALMLQAKSHALAHTAGAICSTAEILQRLSTLARTSIEHFIVFDEAGRAREGEKRDPDKRLKEGFVLDLRGGIEKGFGPCVAGLSFDKEGRPSIKLANSHEALKTLGDYLGLAKMTQEEPEEVRTARELMQRVLSDPDAARALDTVALSVERVRVSLQATKGKA